MNNTLDDRFSDDDPIASRLIEQCIQHHLLIWHIKDGGDFLPYRLQLSAADALLLIEGTENLHDRCIIRIDERMVERSLHEFTKVFSWGGNYRPVSLKHLIVPKKTKADVALYIDKYRLADFADLIWYILARLQVFYSERISFGVPKGKEHMKVIRKSQGELAAIERLVQYAFGRNIQQENLSVTVKQGNFLQTISSRMTIRLLVDGFVRENLTENGRLIPNWREKIASFESSHAIKNDFEFIHLNFSIAFMEFLKRQHIVTGDKITAQYLNPVVELLNISQYPFIKDGYEVTPRHIKSVLKNTNYTLPSE